MTSPLEVRQVLIDALQLDLVGPTGPLGDHKELLTQTPSRWYLTGFLVPTDADEEQRCDPTSNDELDQAADLRDEGFIFQVELELQSAISFIARPNLRSLESDDWGEW